MPVPSIYESGSFRDRSGRVFYDHGQVYRALGTEGFADWSAVAQRPFVQKSMKSGSLVRTETTAGVNAPLSDFQCEAVLKHDVVPVVTWPFEWSFSMLRSAALLTLDLMLDALQEDAILKDGTPYNVQFIGACPTWIDTGSILPLRPGQIWDGYRQFCQMFLYPLMLQSWKNVDFQPWLRGSLEGISPREFSSLLSMRDMFRRGAVSHVWLHAKLQGQNAAKPKLADSIKASGFSRDMIISNVQGLRRIVEHLTWKADKSTWSDYDKSSTPVQRDAAIKEQFIAEVCRSRTTQLMNDASKTWKTVWDLGCNQGRYARLAAQHAEAVLAIDSDHLTIDRLFRTLNAEGNRTITPMVCNLADPSPSLGWRLQERRSLEQRSKPELVFCLALIHHLVIGSNLLLADVISWLASLKSTVVLEYVDRKDAQVQQLLANREDVFSDYSIEAFRAHVDRSFTVIKELPLADGTRSLFWLQPRI
jgi:hypothetical protein